MMVMGIETSCDETSVALVEVSEAGRVVIWDQLIASQIKEHRPFGGIVPEIATRQHLLHLEKLTQEILKRQKIEWSNLSGIGVTRGPGLASSLLIGLSFAKGLAMATCLPWIGVNHLEGHIFSAFLADGKMPDEPHIALLVSGGHTLLTHVEINPYRYTVLGSTRDDAAGEAFDKAAQMLGLGYPGGPEIEALAKNGNPKVIHFPRAMLDHSHFDASSSYHLSFSFSGLKTALKVYLAEHPAARVEPKLKADIAASFQEAVVDVLVQKSKRACMQTGAKLLTISGGVSCNQRLRETCSIMAEKNNIRLLAAPKALTTDNAAMIAFVSAARLKAGQRGEWNDDIDPNLKLSSFSKM